MEKKINQREYHPFKCIFVERISHFIKSIHSKFMDQHLFYCGRLPRVKVTASRSDLFFTQPHQRRYTSLSLHTPLSRLILMTFLILAKLEGIPSSSTAVVERHTLKHGFSYNAL